MIFSRAAFSDYQVHAFPVLLVSLAIAGGIFCFPLSYLSHSNVLIGLLLFPFALMITGGRRNNVAYLSCVVIFAAIALIYHLRIAYFFTLAFFILWTIEYLKGRCNPIVLFLLAFMSPVFTQVTTILGFPLRLQLSNMSASILRLAGLHARAEGNMIVLDGSVFSVDEACMGLNMLAMSMLMAVFVLSYRYRVSGRHIGLMRLGIFFMIVFVLNLATNLFRIVMLVLFHIPPEDFMHDVIGLLCFFVYTILPVYGLSAWITMNGREITTFQGSHAMLTGLQKTSLLLFAVGVFFTGMKVGAQRADVHADYADVFYPGEEVELLGGGISKIANAELLIYIKPIPEFFTGEHTPLMCWKGSGYVFSGVEEIVVDGQAIYRGKLVKGDDELFTAWWYSNGKVRTTSQIEWRMRMLKGEDKFCLVNMTAKDEETLLRNVGSVFRDNSLAVRFSDR